MKNRSSLSENDLCALVWAKTNPYKPLMSHLIETGVIARLLLEANCFRSALEELARRTGAGKDKVLSFFSYIASLHDIGKAHPAFLARHGETRAAMEQMGIAYCGKEKIRHEAYSEAVIRRLWPTRKEDFPNAAKEADTLGESVGKVVRNHHNRSRDGSVAEIARPWRDAFWDLQSGFERRLWKLFIQPAALRIGPDLPEEICTDIIILAAWIASGPAFASSTSEGLSDAQIAANAERIFEGYGYADFLVQIGRQAASFAGDAFQSLIQYMKKKIQAFANSLRGTFARGTFPAFCS